MKKEIDLTRLQKLLEKAEQIADTVKNPQLKYAAFGKIIDILFAYKEGEFLSEVSIKRGGKGRKVKEKREKKKSEGPKLWLEELIEENFFKTPQNMSEILKKLAERGHNLECHNITFQLKELTTGKQLRRKKQAPTKGKKEVWYYSNW